MKLIGLMSAYREGSLAWRAWHSLDDAHLDDIIVFEGAAGADRCDDAPATDYRIMAAVTQDYRTDAEKLTAMLQYARASHPGPLWAVWLAGDEILVNGRYLRDLLQRVEWDDEGRGASMLDPDNFPSYAYGLRQVEHDGSVGRVLARCVRLDLIRRYVVSSHVLELVNGSQVTIGSLPDSASEWIDPHVEAYVPRDQHFLVPPLPCEPFTVHRPELRHPLRQKLRMHEQERSELERLGLPSRREPI